ncbi:uncharacterized protein [Cicer arietinum]|uniref:uncharacterized protein n=1 Tax=Cicer arietinum TaxID=3827 RepID=UPI003CC5CA97
MLVPEKLQQRYFKQVSIGPHSSKTCISFLLQCDQYKRIGNILKRYEMPKNNVLEVKIIDLWRVDFMGPFPSSLENQYILVVVDYVSKWIEVVAASKNDAKVVIKLFKKEIFLRFGVPRVVISDRGSHFIAKQFEGLIKSGQVEVSNREIKSIHEKTIFVSRKDWCMMLDDGLCTYCTSYMTPIGMNPYKLTYGKSCHLSVELKHKAYWAIKTINFNLKVAGEKRKLQLIQLDELGWTLMRTLKSTRKEPRSGMTST